jgi:radical SAM superfamily enzyme YgiQ (UPF0313 family)
VKVLLISTYDLGHQPFGLASPAAWLRHHGHEVVCADLSVASFPEDDLLDAGLVAFYLPMHTATRLAAKVLGHVRAIRPDITICAYGLYAPLSEDLLRDQGVDVVIGGEFEEALSLLAGGAKPPSHVILDRLTFLVPDRSGLPDLARYARLIRNGETRVSGYTEASRGCKHRCLHCPIVPVYNGAFRIVQPDVVLEDVRAQVAQGATHITFGDPDFFNGPTHAVRVVENLHREFPGVSYDVTIKIEHLLKHRDLLPVLRDTRCAFVTSAVESLDDSVLAKLEKGHTRRDFETTVDLFRREALVLSPTFIAFTPWTTPASYRDFLRTLHRLDLVDCVNPVQLTLRLLITKDSPLLGLEDIRRVSGAFDGSTLAHPWEHVDPAVDALARAAMRVIARAGGASRRAIFREICALAEIEMPRELDRLPRAAIPYLNEPWYC